MSTQDPWGIRPIFITSTFRDMHAERDHLRHVVFPELEERLKKRRHHLESIDLRWGVETANEKDEHAKEMLVLKVCLAEVERSRPFLIGLIGGRYGWIPPKERVRAAALEAGMDGDYTGRSVTALEIEYGVLHQPGQQHRSFFYFRDPSVYTEMPVDIAADYSDAHRLGCEKEVEKLEQLKNEIRTQFPDRTREYSAKWDSKKQVVNGLEEWGQQVLEDLWKVLNEETKEFTQQMEPTWQEEERFTLDQFIEDRAQDFIGREVSLERVLSICSDNTEASSTWGLCVTGLPGSGKSAFYSQLNRKLQKDHPEIFVLSHAAGISPSSTQVHKMLQRWIEELSSELKISPPDLEEIKQEELDEHFRSLLSRVSRKRRVVVLIDALNQFETTPRAQHLTWLPKVWPKKARLITTAIPGSESQALLNRDGIEEHVLLLLSELEAKDIAHGICKRYHRVLPPEVLDVLLEKQTEEIQRSAGNPLWLQMAVEELNLLDSDDFARADKEFTGNPEQQLHQLLATTAKELPESVAGLYNWVLNRAEQLHGKEWAQAFINLIAISRYGWREKDLEHLMPIVSGESWDSLKFSTLRRTFRSHITQKGSEAQWDFAHAQMRIAVGSRNLSSSDKVRSLHHILSGHLLNLAEDDPLHISETMFHLYQADDIKRATCFYGSKLSKKEKLGSTSIIAIEILNNESHSVNPALKWVCSMLHLKDIPLEICYEVCFRFLLELSEALEDYSKLVTQKELFKETEKTLQLLTQKCPDNLMWRRELSVSQEKLSDIYQQEGDNTRALTYGLRSSENSDKILQQEPASREWQRNLSLSYIRVGDVYLALGDEEESLRVFKKSLAILEQLLTYNPDNRIWIRDLYTVLDRIGPLYFLRGDANKGLFAFFESHKLIENLIKQDPDNFTYQRDYSVSFRNIGNIYLYEEDKLEEALTAYKKGLTLSEKLIEKNPDNKVWLGDVASTKQCLGDLYYKKEKYGKAISLYQNSNEVYCELSRQDPKDKEWRFRLSDTYSQLGDAYLANGEHLRALSAYKENLAINKGLWQENPEDTSNLENMLISYDKLAQYYLQQNSSNALLFLNNKLQMNEKLVEKAPDNFMWKDRLVHSIYQLASYHEKIGDRGESDKYWSCCFNLLVRMNKSGMPLDDFSIKLLRYLEKNQG